MANKAKRSKKAQPKRKGKAAVIVIIIVIIIIAALLAGCSMAATSYSRIYPNVYVGGLDVGGMTEAEAREAISENLVAAGEIRDMTVRVLDQDYIISADSVRGDENAQLLAEQAFAAGRDTGFFGKILHRFGVAGNIDISSGSVISEAFLAEVLSGVLCDKIDSAAEVDGDWLILTKGRDGVSADLAYAAECLSMRYSAGDYSAVYIIEAVEDTADLIDINELFAKYCTAPEDAFYNVETGEVVPHKDGFGFDIQDVKAQLDAAKPGEKVHIPMKKIPAAITTDVAAAALFENTLYTCTTPLTNIPNRTNNVALAASAMNGTVIMPGETFSFNKTVGERTAEKGYKPADVYVAGNTVGELGGGVCQAASTLYVCCLYTDLEIVERAEHQFFVTYVPAGLDATIYWGFRDYQFKNNTDYPIKIEAFVEGLELTVTLKGEKSNDNYVEMISETLDVNPFEEVEEVDETKAPDYRELKHTGYTGYTIKTYRNVYDKDGNLLESSHEATSYYNRRDKTWIVGPQEEEPSPEIPEVPPAEGDTPIEGGEVPPADEDVPVQGDPAVPPNPEIDGGQVENSGDANT